MPAVLLGVTYSPWSSERQGCWNCILFVLKVLCFETTSCLFWSRTFRRANTREKCHHNSIIRKHILTIWCISITPFPHPWGFSWYVQTRRCTGKGIERLRVIQRNWMILREDTTMLKVSNVTHPLELYNDWDFCGLLQGYPRAVPWGPQAQRLHVQLWTSHLHGGFLSCAQLMPPCFGKNAVEGKSRQKRASAAFWNPFLQ